MDDLNLEQNEHILRRTKDVWRFDGDEETELEALFLTNKHLISVYKKSVALFFEGKTIVDKKPLGLISVIDSSLQVKNIIDGNFGEVLQIIFDNGMEETYSFGDSHKSECQQWVNDIKKAFIENAKDVIKNDKTSEDSLVVEENKQATTNKDRERTDEGSDMFIFCTNCAAKNSIEAKFCQNCGNSLMKVNSSVQNSVPHKEEPSQSTYYERKQEYAGKIIKCPSCGAQLSSFTAICPDCGHEINSQKISSSIKEFMDAINEYDRIIANNLEPPKTGWKTWNKGIKVGWIILNIITFCIPLVIYLTFPLIKPFILPRNIPKLSPDEKRKAALIENYVFPNERETVVEAMMFTKSKIAFLASEMYNRKTLFWLNLWNTKAEQLKQRADIILKGDKIVEETYREIITNKNKINKCVKTRAIIGTMIMVFFLLFVLIKRPVIGDIIKLFSHSSNMPQISKEDEKDTKESVKWSDMFLSDYFPEPVLTNAYVYSNSKEECNIGQINCSQSEYYAYCRQCKEWGFDYEIVKEDDTWFTAYNSEGYKVHVSYIGSDLSVELNAPMKMSDFNWPESEIGQIVPVPQSTYGKISWEYDSGFLIYIGNMSYENFSEYATLLHKSGFNINDRKGDYYFWADNADGYHISIEYEGFNIVWLRADAPDDK